MRQLHQRLQQSEQLAITAATGMGGIGKTDLAWHYAAAHQTDYPAGIWWIATAQLVVKVLEYSLRMGLAQPPEEADEAAKVQWCYDQWLNQFPEGARLMVWDDLGDAEDYRRLQPFLPTDARFRLLITTRSQLGHPVRRLELGVLKPSAAFRLLRQLVEHDSRIAPEVEQAKTLCKWLGYLPLGIELVGRHLALHPNLRLDTLLSRLEAKKLEARALQQVAPEMPYRDSLAAAFELSWQSLSEAAQQVGGLLSLFALAPIPPALIRDCLRDWDEEDLEEALDRELVGGSLLNVLETGDYLLHPLVRQFFAAKLSAAAEPLQRGFVLAMVKVAKTIPQTVTLEVIARVETAIPHLEAATRYTGLVDGEDSLWPYAGAASFYKGQSLWQQAERLYGDCKTMSEARFGPDHSSTAASLNNLAELYRTQGRYAEAEPFFLQALQISRTQLGPDHSSTATSLNNLAGLYQFQGRYAEAEPFYLQSLEICRTQLGANHPSTATNLNNLASLYQSQGRYAEAESYLLQSLEIRRTQLGAKHPDTATSLNNLASLYQSQGRYAEAEPYLLQSLEICRTQLGPDHPSTAASLNNLAELYRVQGRYSEAEPYYLQSLEICRTQLGADHPDTATNLNNLALLYKSQGRYSEAEPYYLRALQIRRTQLGAEHPSTAASLNNLASLYKSQGRYAEAEPYYLQSLEICRAQLGVDHPSTAASLWNLGVFYVGQGRYSEAEPCYLQALTIFMEKLGENHPNTQTVWQNFVYLLRQAIAAGRAAELSDHPMTQAVLAELRAR